MIYTMNPKCQHRQARRRRGQRSQLRMHGLLHLHCADGAGAGDGEVAGKAYEKMWKTMGRIDQHESLQPNYQLMLVLYLFTQLWT